MKPETWICPLGEEYDVLCGHPYKDEFCLIGMSGHIRWMPYWYLETKWSKK